MAKKTPGFITEVGTSTHTMSVRISSDLYARISEAKKNAKRFGATINVNKAFSDCAEKMLDEYDVWYRGKKAEIEAEEKEASSAGVSDAKLNTNTNTKANTENTASPLGFGSASAG